MSPDPSRGFALVSAIFLLVVLAALGGYIATVSTSQQVGAALDVMSARAYQAARAGTEWGLYQALRASSCLSQDIGQIQTMYVTVNCSSQPTDGVTDTGSAAHIYTITATACNFPTGTGCPGAAGRANYVERSITVVADNTAQ